MKVRAVPRGDRTPATARNDIGEEIVRISASTKRTDDDVRSRPTRRAKPNASTRSSPAHPPRQRAARPLLFSFSFVFSSFERRHGRASDDVVVYLQAARRSVRGGNYRARRWLHPLSLATCPTMSAESSLGPDMRRSRQANSDRGSQSRACLQVRPGVIGGEEPGITASRPQACRTTLPSLQGPRRPLVRFSLAPTPIEAQGTRRVQWIGTPGRRDAGHDRSSPAETRPG